MQLLIVLCAVLAVSQAGYLAGPAAIAAPAIAAPALAAPGILANPAAVLAARGLLGAPALAAPGLLASPLAAAVAARGIVTAPAAAIAAPGLLASPLAAAAVPALAAPTLVAPAVVPAAATLSAGGPAGLTAISAAGTPIETPAVQAGRITDAVAHATAKATLLG